MLRQTIIHHVRTYLSIGCKAFLIGAAIDTFVHLVFAENYTVREWLYGSVRTGGLTAIIWLYNGMLAEGLPISWVEEPKKRLLISLVLTIAGTWALTAAWNALTLRLRFGQWPDNLLSEDYGFFYYNVILSTLLISTFLHGRQFLADMRAAITEREQLKRAQLASRYESLQNQVNPHFLFNSLNVLSNLVYKDADLSARFIGQLSEVYRYVLEVRDQDVVPLSRELQVLEAYLFLLRMRFGDSLRVEQRLQAPAEEMIPPLSLQMLVENAVKHNVISGRHPLTIRLERSAAGDLVVWNNLQKRPDEQTSLGVGLENIRGRYRLLSGREVVIEPLPDAFRVTLPALRVEKASYAHSSP